MANDVTTAPTGGLDGVLHSLDLSMGEFVLCVLFWLSFLVVSSFISLNMILGMTDVLAHASQCTVLTL